MDWQSANVRHRPLLLDGSASPQAIIKRFNLLKAEIEAVDGTVMQSTWFPAGDKKSRWFRYPQGQSRPDYDRADSRQRATMLPS
jgi:hypothetical protein